MTRPVGVVASLQGTATVERTAVAEPAPLAVAQPAPPVSRPPEPAPRRPLTPEEESEIDAQLFP